MSMFYLDRDPNTVPPTVLIVDEAHSLVDMLKTLASKRFPVDKWGKPDSLDQVDIEAWLERQTMVVKHLMAKAAKTDIKAFIRHRSELDSIELVLESYRAAPEHYVITREQDKYRGKDSESTYLRPIFPPPVLVRQMLGAHKIILMSATLLETDVKLLAAGREYLRLDSPSPIDKARRPLVYAPLGQRVNYRTPPEALATHALALLARHPGENAIIHATYELAAKLAPLLSARIPGLITHTAETKESQLDVFKAKGGVFLASGCSEGVDLPGDLCRVNIILSLQRGNPSSPEVRLRLALPGGREEYELTALKTVIQQTGRSTRGETDKSVTYICDPQFPEYYLKQKPRLPISFCEAIVWKLPTKAGK
jgi:Rad3-related DNA helicase